MLIKEIITVLEIMAPRSLQEDYDNAGLIAGDENSDCSGVLVCLDVTEKIIAEAINKKCNLIISHHPVVFKAIKKINNKTYTGRIIIEALKNDIAIYAIHTNLDNVRSGVNDIIAEKLNLSNRQILQQKPGILYKLYTYAPVKDADKVRNALFAAGAGNIGNYHNCSYNTPGKGTFTPEKGADPYVGEIGEWHIEDEIKIEVIVTEWYKDRVLNALMKSHPYEEVAYELIALENTYQEAGAGLIGEFEQPVNITDFLNIVKEQFGIPTIRHSELIKQKISKVAVCGGTGSFLIPKAITSGADIFLTADLKYHEFFNADGQIILADIGHFESEQYTIDLLAARLNQKFPTFAVLKTENSTNPVQYF